MTRNLVGLKVGTATVLAVFVLVLGAPQPAHADSDTALGVVGGLMIGKMVSDRNKQRQDDAYRQGQRDQYYSQQQRQYQQQQYQQQQYQQQQARQQQTQSVETRLSKLKSLHDQGLISDADYEQRRAEILKEI